MQPVLGSQRSPDSVPRHGSTETARRACEPGVHRAHSRSSPARALCQPQGRNQEPGHRRAGENPGHDSAHRSNSIRASAAVIQPSQFEGWSTVIEDARALGKPLIASDFPVHLEQNIPNSSFFRMGDPADCALAITHFLKKKEIPPSSPSVHDARILEFARTFLNIVNSTLARPQSVKSQLVSSAI